MWSLRSKICKTFSPTTQTGSHFSYPWWGNDLQRKKFVFSTYIFQGSFELKEPKERKKEERHQLSICWSWHSGSVLKCKMFTANSEELRRGSECGKQASLEAQSLICQSHTTKLNPALFDFKAHVLSTLSCYIWWIQV